MNKKSPYGYDVNAYINKALGQMNKHVKSETNGLAFNVLDE